MFAHKLLYKVVYTFRLVSSEMFFLFLLKGNFYLIIYTFLAHMCGRPLKCWGPCSAEHVRTLLNPAICSVITSHCEVKHWTQLWLSSWQLKTTVVRLQ